MPPSQPGINLTGPADVAAIIGALGVVAAVYNGGRAILRRTILSRRDLQKRLNLLACNVTTNYIDSLFGPPVIQRLLDPVMGVPRFVTEQIYRTRHAWLQVLSDESNTVQAFSITVTDPRFRYRTRHLTFDQLDIRIGAVAFRELPPQLRADGWKSWCGARRFGHTESYWFGNPGCYQCYLLSYNDGGIGHYLAPPADALTKLAADGTGGRLGKGHLPGFDGLPGWLRALREGYTVNTLTVLGPGTPAALADLTGVDADTVRLLRDPQLARRRRRAASRRMRKITAEVPVLGLLPAEAS